MEGEAIAVAAKISQMVRGKDLVEALHVLHAIQVSFRRSMLRHTLVASSNVPQSHGPLCACSLL